MSSTPSHAVQSTVFRLIEHIQEPGLATVTVCGDLDHATAHLFRAALSRTADTWPDELVVDLRQVTFINARGLACLLEAAGTARTRRQRLTLCCRPGLVARMVVLVGLGDRTQVEFPAYLAAQLSALLPAALLGVEVEPTLAA